MYRYFISVSSQINLANNLEASFCFVLFFHSCLFILTNHSFFYAFVRSFIHSLFIPQIQISRQKEHESINIRRPTTPGANRVHDSSTAREHGKGVVNQKFQLHHAKPNSHRIYLKDYEKHLQYMMDDSMYKFSEEYTVSRLTQVAW